MKILLFKIVLRSRASKREPDINGDALQLKVVEVMCWNVFHEKSDSEHKRRRLSHQESQRNWLSPVMTKHQWTIFAILFDSSYFNIDEEISHLFFATRILSYAENVLNATSPLLSVWRPLVIDMEEKQAASTDVDDKKTRFNASEEIETQRLELRNDLLPLRRCAVSESRRRKKVA